MFGVNVYFVFYFSSPAATWQTTGPTGRYVEIKHSVLIAPSPYCFTYITRIGFWIDEIFILKHRK